MAGGSWSRRAFGVLVLLMVQYVPWVWSDCSACTETEGMCDGNCNTCLITGAGPAWLQGTWSGYIASQAGNIVVNPTKAVKLTVTGDTTSYEAYSYQNIPLLAHSYYRKSAPNPGGVEVRDSEYDVDDDVYAPFSFATYSTYSVVRLQEEAKYGTIETISAVNAYSCAGYVTWRANAVRVTRHTHPHTHTSRRHLPCIDAV